MKITRLHIVMFLLIIALGAECAYQYDLANKQKAVLASMAKREIEQKKQEEKRAAEDKLQKESWANQSIAVAGEAWKTARMEGRDVRKGQETLRLAKQYFAQEHYNNSIDLALQSIQELESAPHLDIKYSVKRGDCLWNIAKKPEHYGKGADWVKIWKANRQIVRDYNLIYPKQELIIPKTSQPSQDTLPKEQPEQSNS